MIVRHPLCNLDPFKGFSTLIQSAFEGVEKTWGGLNCEHQLYATEEGWVLHVDAAGAQKEDISITFQDGGLDLETKHPEFGFSKRFELGEDVDAEGIKVRFESGVIELKLPKKNPKKEIIVE